MGPDLWELFEDGNGDDEVAAIVRLGRSSVLPKGVRVVTQFSEIITIRTSRANIPSLSGSPEVADIAAGDTYLGPDLEAETADFAELSSDTILPTDQRRPADEKATGRGVVVGSVDWGFDFAHPDFLNADGSTRILALWDQRGSRLPNSPQPFGYGVVHTRDDINHALKQKDPYVALGYHPADADTGIGCHGTHVLSIAAGGGGEDRPAGIAPEADLVLVHNAPWDEVDTGRLGDSVTLLEAIDFISRTAGERPWVINLSMGRHGEQHDGSTLIEQGLDAAIRTAPGRAICLSAGNYFDKRIHASGQLRPTQERTIVWEILEGKPTNNQLEFWYSWQDRFEVTVRSPDGSIAARAGIGERSKFMVGGKEVGNVYHRGQEPNNLDNHITIYLYKEAPAGEWEVTLIGTDVIDGRYHAWVERDVSCASCQSRLRPDDADPKSTTGTICNGRRTLAVGAYNKHDPEMRLAHFSSVGPTRDGRLKPDLSAPGVSVLAARSAPRVRSDRVQLLTRMSGTSMAAPHVTGTVALMFQAAPRRLRIEETHNLLLQSARKVSVPEEIPERIGIGFLDIEEAVDAARKIRASSATFKQTTVQSSAAAKPKAAEVELDAETAEGTPSLSAEEGFEGRADAEYDLTETSPYQNTFHRIANDITSAFEGGKTGTLNLYDLGVISYGKHQATLHSGTLLGILKRFTELSSSATSTKMATYLDRVTLRDETLREDASFIGLLKDAAKEPEMDQAQDEEFGRQYWEPAKNKAAKLKVKTALGHAIFYDTRIQGGLDQVAKSVEEKLGGITGQTVNGKAISELDSLRAFVDERIQRNLRISAYQVKQAAALNQAAKDLEDAASAAADPALAEDQKKQAAEKRKKAKEYSANAAALNVSSTRTRGPSFAQLVASGDLNLYDGDTGKILLKGKPGVAIDSLKPGAAIDANTPAPEAEQAQAAASDSASIDELLRSVDESRATAQAGEFAMELAVTESEPSPSRPAEGADWVELAGQIIADMEGGQPPVRVLHEMFERSDDLDDLATVAGGGQPTAAQIFDSFVYSTNSPLGEKLAGNFELVALPSESVEGGVRAGDIMVRRAEGPSAHVSIVAAPGLKSLESLATEGLTAESRSPGKYVQVVEGGAFPHETEDKYARQLTDSFGRVLNDIVLLRLATPPPVVNITQAGPAAKDDPFASVQDAGSGEAETDQESLSDNADHFDMTELPPVVSSHQIILNGVPLKYTATAGRLPIKSANGEVEAQMFFVAYTLDGQDASKRPLTFAFNGGPGSASLWLHMGALGPRKVVLQPDGFLPPAPYRVENNPYTMLDKSDLVLIDAIGTGFSRASSSETFEKFWGVRGDILAFSEFIRLYITRTERWGSPLFLMGESYGTMRAAGIAGYLAGKGISFNGITLLSTVLNYETLEATKTNDQPYTFLIPTFTMIAGFHGRLPAVLLQDMNRARQAAEKWASGDYALALSRGDALTPAERQRITEQLACFTGLSKDIVDQANLRIDVSKFTHYLLLDKKLRVGRFDGRFTGPDPDGLLDTQFYDPTEAATHPPFTSVFNNYLRSELGYKTDMPYYTRAQDADSGTWNWGSAIAGFPDTASALREAILRNPYLKILVMEGLYDLATPFSAANYTMDHLDLPAKFRSNISFATYEAGHMVYLPEAGLRKLKADLANFTVQSAATRALAPGESSAEAAAASAEDDASVLAAATRELSLQAIGDGNQGQLPKDVLEAILTRGADDANDLTNTVFWRQHPDLAGKTLDSDDPKQQALRAEWSVILRRRVKPVIWLRAMIDVLDRFRGTIPRDFLLGWIAVESDGLLSSSPGHSRDELGYFQIMWSSGEAKLQLNLTEKEFARLATDAEFSIEKGVALAEAYRQHILRTYPSVPDCSDLLWRLAKGRHAASGALKSVLDTLVRTSTPITWNTASQRMPLSMRNNITHTMDFAAKLKPFADLVPESASATCAPGSGTAGGGSGSAGGGTFLEWGERSDSRAEDTGILGASDDRIRVTPTTQPPWRWMCNLELLDSLPGTIGPARSSGVLISDRHVLTAAHAVWDRYVDPARFSLQVFPGRNFDDTFGGYVASKVRVCPNYKPSNDDADQWDYALITLDKAIGKMPFDAIQKAQLRFWGAEGTGTRYTMSPSDALTMARAIAVTAGYPENKDSGRELWCAKGRLHSVSLKGNPNTMRTTASMTLGQSGAPFWIQIGDQLCMVGISIVAGTSMNRVLRVSPEMIGNLRAWFSADGETPWMAAPAAERHAGESVFAESRSRNAQAQAARFAESPGPDAPVVETFPSVEFLDHEEFAKIVMVRETPKAPNLLEESSELDSAGFSATESSELSAINGIKAVTPAGPRDANYQLKWKGRIYYPRGAAAGSVAGARPFPVAVILHGQHDWRSRATGAEIDNHLGYEYLQKELAGRGIVSLSIGTNPANLLNSFIRTRAEFVLHGLRILKRFNEQAGHRLFKRLDFENVGLMGHSRGGDAVVKAALLNLGSPDFRIRAVCSLAPTDFTGTTNAPLGLPASGGLRYFVLYGSHDGDVGGQFGDFTGTGFRHYDRATCERSMAFVKGAKHDRFNTRWDDNPGYSDPSDCALNEPDALSAPDHLQLAIDYICGLFRLELNHETSLKGLFDGSTAPSGAHAIAFQWSPPRTPRTITALTHGTPLDPSDQWTTGWTTLMPVRLPGSNLPYELAYKKDTGEVTIDLIDPATGTTSLWKDTWNPGWTHFMPFFMPGDDRQYDLAYKAGTGEIAIDRIARNGKSVEVNIWKDTWATGWTSFIPIRLHKDRGAHFLVYNAGTGDVALHRVNPIGKGTEAIFKASWSSGWTSFLPFLLPGDSRPCYLAYKQADGTVDIDQIDADGKNIKTLWTGSRPPGSTSFAAFRVPGDDAPYFLAYRKDTGDVSVDRVFRDGSGTETVWKDKWTTNWSHFLAFEAKGKSHFLAYKVDQGDVAIGRLLPDKMLEVEDFEDRGVVPYDPAHDRLNGGSSSSGLTRLFFNAAAGATPIVVQHQTFVLTGKTSGAKYRAEIPPQNRDLGGFDMLTFRMASDFKLDDPALIAAGKLPDFRVRVTYGRPGGAGAATAEASQNDIDRSAVRARQRPFFRKIMENSCIIGTKIALGTIAIPFTKFVGVNWHDVRTIEFESGAGISSSFYIDSLALVQS